MSKTPEETESEMEAGMTTAERRRRRRRGAGLRVPSDNVPRQNNSSPSVVPLPDDPSVAIAYNAPAGGEPTVVQSVEMLRPDPMAPEAVSTLIDPPGEQAIEEVSFESKTREMSAVDLEELGIAEQEAASAPRPAQPGAPATVIVSEPSTPVRSAPPPLPAAPPAASTHPGVPPPPATAGGAPAAPTRTALSPVAASPSEPALKSTPTPGADDLPPPRPALAKGRAPTLALSDDDLEELLDENRRQLAGEPGEGEFEVEMEVDAAGAAPTSEVSSETSGALRTLASMAASGPAAAPPGGASGSQAAAPVHSTSPPTLDRTDRTERSDWTESFEREPQELALNALGLPVAMPPASADGPPRSKATSVPPPMPAALPSSAPAAAGPAAAGPGNGASTAAPGSSPLGPAGTRPTPPPAPAKPPPAPPKKPEKRPGAPVATAAPAAAAPAAASGPGDEKKRARAWFAEVFDEDYLRTLPFLTPQATQAEAELVAASLSVSPGAKLLDVGCGYGRHAMELAARGYHVVGLDLSTPLLVRGGEEAHRRGLTINFIRGDMREIDFDGQFDGAYCLFSTFGYFDDETNKKTAGNIARALRPNGRCVFEILNRDYVIADLPTRVWWEGDGCVVLEEVDFNYFSSRICVNRSVVFDDGRQVEQEISIRAYSLHEVGKLMLAAGFRVLEVSGSYQTRGRFFGNQSRHIIVVAERV